ncbi:cartilage matrix protein-like [Lingula anatina]|uniref:Cartilage matrix protein-like n=1 Tax=Lingula anatina TaxID=7574 RepID=A0A1S3JX88_LINAN|nr:cartilage matrix protein-like [Lingula anatina]|eukprot:XP_013415045.2 cartilage matrix protein-like [Lingula anatina]
MILYIRTCFIAALVSVLSPLHAASGDDSQLRLELSDLLARNALAMDKLRAECKGYENFGIPPAPSSNVVVGRRQTTGVDIQLLVDIGYQKAVNEHLLKLYGNCTRHTTTPKPSTTTTVITTTTTSSTTSTTTARPVESCMDKTDCSRYANDICIQFPKWSADYCKFSCGFCSCSVLVADVAFILDASGSVGSANFNKMKDFVRNFVSSFNIGNQHVQIALIQYSSRTTIESYFSNASSKAEVYRTIDQIQYTSGNTHTGEAIRDMWQNLFSAKNGARLGAIKIGIVITDGQSSDVSLTTNEAKNARDNGINMFAIGVGTNIKTTELNSIASDPDNRHVFTVSSFADFASIQADFTSGICKGCATLVADVAFVLDASGSVGSANFNKMKDFVRNFVSSFIITNQHVQIGLMQFSSRSTIESYFSDTSTKAEVYRAIDQIQYISGGTNTGDAIRDMWQNLFSDKNGARPGAIKIGIVITDGQSNDMYRTTYESKNARDRGITMFAIGIGNGIKVTELQGIASDPDSRHVYSIASFADFASIQADFAQGICRG